MDGLSVKFHSEKKRGVGLPCSTGWAGGGRGGGGGAEAGEGGEW